MQILYYVIRFIYVVVIMFFGDMVLQNECLYTILEKAPLYPKHRNRLWQHRFAAVLAF